MVLAATGGHPMEIVLDHVSFTYPSGVRALQDVSLRIGPGESVAIVGQNGAGKTTLARLLNGLRRPTVGSVLIGDWDTANHTTARLARRVGYVFQHPDHQIFKRSVRDEVAFGPRNFRLPDERVAALVDQALAETQLTALADRHPHDLIPAQRKLVALASVLAMDTPILVLDEPTSGQDGAGTRLIGGIVERLREAGKTIITISHDIDYCADHCRRFLVMHLGCLLLDGPPEQVFVRPDLLAQTAVEPPQLARLAARLGLPLAWQTEPLLDALEERYRAKSG